MVHAYDETIASRSSELSGSVTSPKCEIGGPAPTGRATCTPSGGASGAGKKAAGKKK